MGKITDIKPQARNKSRVSVYIDGRFCCGLEKITAALHRLKIGDEIYSAFDPEYKKASEILLPLIDDVLQKAGADISCVDYFACCIGPVNDPGPMQHAK